MSYDDNELMRRFQALRGVVSNPVPSTTASSASIVRSEQTSDPRIQQQKKTKKKSRGNRKLQRYRAKLRKQGISDEAIATLIRNDHNQPSNLQNPDQTQTSNINVRPIVSNQQTNLQRINSIKRKREMRVTTTDHLPASVSQMSLSNVPKKRQRSTNTDNQPVQKENYKPKYLKVPDQVLKKMLSNSLVGAESLVQSLNTMEKLQFVRIYAHLLNNVFYLTSEQNFLEHYEKVAHHENIWLLSTDSDLMKKNNLQKIEFKTKAHLVKRQKKIQKQLQLAENKLNEHKQTSMSRTLDMNRLSTIIPAFVRQGQQKLFKEFERKKQLVQFDMHEYQLIKNFYQLKPTEHQISSAKIIWQATRDKLQAQNELTILKQRIVTKRLPASFNILDHSIDNIEQMLQRPVLDGDKRTTLSCRRLKMIAQFKYDLITLAITTTEETIRSHTNLIGNEKKKMVDTTTGGQISLPKPLVQLMNIVAERQSHLIKRNELILQRQLSFFDDAPTTEDMAGVVGAATI